MSDEQVDLANEVKQLGAIVRHLQNELANRDARILELEEAKSRQAAALKAANQAKRAAELAVAAVTLQADPTFDHTAKPTLKEKAASLSVDPAALKHLNPETKVVVSADGTEVSATVRALA